MERHNLIEKKVLKKGDVKWSVVLKHTGDLRRSER